MKQPVLFGSGGSSGIWIQTIAVTAPNGASITVSGGGETLTGTGTGSNYAFQVHNQNTLYTISVTMDGQTKTDTVTTGTAQGAISFVVINFGTINLTYANDFRGKTITCTKSGVSITKTAPSSGNTMTFRVPTTGEWTISGTVSGTPYSTQVTVTDLDVPVSADLQTTITINVTLYGAAGAVITYTDANGSQTQTLDSTGKKTNVSITALPNSSITFTDTTVAKDPDNLSNNYTKAVTITSATTDVYVMPDNALYWYGYQSSNLEVMNAANGWSFSAWGTVAYPNPSFNTRDVLCTATSGANNICGIGTKNAVSCSSVHLIAQGVTEVSGSYGGAAYNTNKNTAPNGQVVVQAALDHYFSSMSESNYILCTGTLNARSIRVHAFWYE